MGHNDGFNPFRSAGGKIAEQASGGKPRRTTKGDPAASVALPQGDGMNVAIRRAAGRGSAPAVNPSTVKLERTAVGEAERMK